VTYIKEVVQVVKMKKAVLSAVAACVAALALMLPTAGGAQAAQQNFCWGANISPGAACGTAYRNMTAAYANSMNGRVCLQLQEWGGSTLGSCTANANEGIYHGWGACKYSYARILNPQTWVIKAYGTLWSC
jgi:hypothetical protein